MRDGFLDRSDLALLRYVVTEKNARGESGAMTGGDDDVRCNQGTGASPLMIVTHGDAIEELAFGDWSAAYDTGAALRTARELCRVGQESRVTEYLPRFRRAVGGGRDDRDPASHRTALGDVAVVQQADELDVVISGVLSGALDAVQDIRPLGDIGDCVYGLHHDHLPRGVRSRIPYMV